MTDPKVLMLGYGWFPDRLGGLNRYYRDLLEHLPEARGVVIQGDASTPARVACISAHSRPLPLRLRAFWRAAQQDAAEAELVDAHFALYALLPLRFGRLRTKPTVIHFHGPWADESLATGDSSRVRLTIRRLLERAAYTRADQAVVLTSAFRQVLVERYRVQPWIVNVEPPGVDVDHFVPGSKELSRKQVGIGKDEFVAITVRRLVPRMGLELLLDAWRAAIPDLPEQSRLLIVGDGPLERELRAIASAYGVNGSVSLTGRVTEDQLVSLYQASDIAVVPTLEHEGFGLVVLEAAACGTASIVTAAGGLPEAVSTLDPSLVVPVGDVEALRARLVRSVVDRPDRGACRTYAERHRWDNVAARHREINRRAVAGARRSRQPLKVVYLDHVARLSGGEIAMLRLLPHLDRVKPHVILAEDGPLVSSLHVAGCSTEVLPLNGTARNLHRGQLAHGAVPVAVSAATAAYVLRLAARLRRLQPDLVHANSLKSGVYGSMAARLAGIPMVWHVRDRIAADYMPHPAVVLIRAMTRRLPAMVLANSESTMATLRGAKHSSIPYSVIPDTVGDVPRRTRVNGRPLTFAVVGRLAPWKGQDLFLRAFAQAFPAGEERAVLIGGALFGEDEYAEELPRLAEQLGITNRVEMRGHRTDVWTELARVDVLVHTSVTPEPFGQIILEGMAAGVPVIAADAGGPAEILQDGHTGVLYRPGETPALAEAMKRLKDRDERERLSTAAGGALHRYSPSAVAAQLQERYEAVVANLR
jgi:glycosyltransferase involved in cell wall biosynthesis